MVSSSDSTSTVSDTTTSIDTQLRNSIHDFENAVSPEWLQKWLGESDQVLHPRFKRFPDAVDFSNTIYDADNLPMSGTGLFWLDSSVNVKGMHVGPYFNQSLYSTVSLLYIDYMIHLDSQCKHWHRMDPRDSSLLNLHVRAQTLLRHFSMIRMPRCPNLFVTGLSRLARPSLA